MNPEDYGPSVMDWRGPGKRLPPFRETRTLSLSDIGLAWNDKTYYNLRKRFGRDIARLLMTHWWHYHLGMARDADEVVHYFLGLRGVE